MRKQLLALIAGSTALAGCHAHAAGGGPTISRNYQVGNFQQIEVAGPYDVEVRTGGNPSVTGTGPEKMLEQIVVEVRGDKLVIHSQDHHGFSLFSFGTRGNARFVVTVPQLSGATIAGSGDTTIDRVQGARFEGSIAGSGDLSITAADVQSLKLSVAGSGDAKAGAGKAQTAEYSIVGSGGVDAGAVQTQQVKVSVAGSGDVKAHATGTAEVSVMGSGDVTISGGAKCNVSKAGSGDVRCS